MGSALVQAAQQLEGAAEEGWADLLKPRYRWIMLLTTILPLVQQLSGINTCILYSSEVRLASESHPDSDISAPEFCTRQVCSCSLGSSIKQQAQLLAPVVLMLGASDRGCPSPRC